jgi:hypothetical protein
VECPESSLLAHHSPPQAHSLPLRAAAELAFGINSSTSGWVHLRESGALDGNVFDCGRERGRGHAEGMDFTRVAGDGLKFARARRVPFPALCIRFKYSICIMRFGALILGNDVWVEKTLRLSPQLHLGSTTSAEAYVTPSHPEEAAATWVRMVTGWRDMRGR